MTQSNSAAITIGADPEMFISNQNGNLVAACGLVGGTKDNPKPLDTNNPGYKIQEDNVLVEFNVPPTTSSGGFAASIQYGIRLVANHLNARNLLMRTSCEEVFTQMQLTDKNAKQFGCDPDYDGYKNGEVWPRLTPSSLRVEPASTKEWRVAGGHIHIGYKAPVPHYVVANFCDVFLQLPYLSYDPQTIRRKFYGQPSRYRPTPYGIEYRTLSNFWIWSESYCIQLGSAAIRLGQLLQDDLPRAQRLYQQIPWGDVQRAISDGNMTLGNYILAHLRDTLDVEI